MVVAKGMGHTAIILDDDFAVALKQLSEAISLED
jgi:hypothetical protein